MFFIKLRSSVLITLLSWVLMSWGVSAFAAPYYYCVVNTTLVADAEEIKPNIPFDLYSYFAVLDGSDITYSRSIANAGKEIMACVAVKAEDKEAIKNWTGYVGETFNEIKNSLIYQKHYPHTIGDMKRTYDEKTNKFIKYTGADKDEPARFSMWCENEG